MGGITLGGKYGMPNMFLHYLSGYDLVYIMFRYNTFIKQLKQGMHDSYFVSLGIHIMGLPVALEFFGLTH